MKNLLAVLLVSCVSLSAFSSQVLIEDFFDDGNLGTSAQDNGGFSTVGSGGSADEDSGTFARISNAPNGSSYGILSLNSFQWDPSVPGQDLLRTTLRVSNSDLKKSTSLLTLLWQEASNSDFSSPEIRLEIDIVNSIATIYDESGMVGMIDVDTDFGETGDAFTIITEFSVDDVLLRGHGAFRDVGGSTLEAKYENPGVNWEFPFSPAQNFRVGLENIASSQGGLVVDADSLTIEAIPEPAVIAFIGIFGGGMLVARRWFNN